MPPPCADAALLQTRNFYKAQLILGSICLGGLLSTLAWLSYSVRRSQREGRTW